MPHAFLVLFPFDIKLAEHDTSAPIDLLIDGRRATFYWPFWHEKEAGRQIHCVNLDWVPSRPGYPSWAIQPCGLTFTILPGAGRAFADGLRLDVEAEPTETQLVNGLVVRLLRQIRARTGQWWIGHAHREGQDFVRGVYAVDVNGIATSRDALGGVKISPFFGSERTLTAADFALSCAAVAADADVQPYFDVFYDAVYFIIESGDVRRALLETCIACDIAVLYEAIRAGERIGKSELEVRSALSDRDLLINLRAGLSKIFGTIADYRTANPEDYELVRQLWIARCAIAHGRSPIIGALEKAKLPAYEHAADMMLAAFRLIGWLQRLPNLHP